MPCDQAWKCDFESPSVLAFNPVDTEPLSQFWECKPKLVINGRQYASVEHWMQSQKFAGTPAENEIADAPDAATAHQLGTTAPNIRQDWDAIKLKVSNALFARVNTFQLFRAGNRAKFQQNAEARAALLKSAGKQLVQIDTDMYWGAHVSESKPGSAVGSNVAGNVLQEIREEVLQGIL